MSPRGWRDRGFALVGVVMFILVLTILGLSLFSLSGFESQFMFDSLDRTEALYAAQSGLERARFVLVSQKNLQAVSFGLPFDHVDYAIAKQGPNTSGPVDWQGDPILIRVRGNKNGKTKTIEAMFHPADLNLYDRLLTSSASAAGDTGLFVYRRGHQYPQDDRHPQTFLQGEVWQNLPMNSGHVFPFGGAGGLPQQTAPSTSGVTFRPWGGVPPPDVQGYLSQFYNQLGTTTAYFQQSAGKLLLVLNASGKPNNVGFFKSSWNSGDYTANIEFDEAPQIEVNGTAILMFPKGLRCYHTLQVSAIQDGTPDLLVIVSGQSPGSNTGFMLHGAIDAMYGPGKKLSVPVILVTDGRVVLQHHHDYMQESQIDWLSIYAAKALFMGPFNPNKGSLGAQPVMLYRHPANQVPQALETLLDLGLLPNLQGGVRHRLVQVAGTWREVAEGDSL